MSGESEDDEAELFRAAMRNVRPLGTRPRTPEVRRRPPARARFARAGAAVDAGIGTLAAPTRGPAMADAGAGAGPLSFRRPGVQDAVLRKLRRGQIPAAAEIDLHGLTAAAAEGVLVRFLGTARARGLRCVRVVHGKGQRSGERGPVLKATVDALLRRSPAVLAFVSAPPADGGTGATCVLLQRKAP